MWNGLWSLPEFADSAAADDFLRQRGARPSSVTLAAIKHSFSHYHLQLEPRCARVSDRVAEAAADYAAPARAEQAWFSPADLATIGLPAPIRRLIVAYFDQANLEFHHESHRVLQEAAEGS